MRRLLPKILLLSLLAARLAAADDAPWLERGQAALAAGQADVALEDFGSAAAGDPGSVAAVVGQAQSLLALGRAGEALPLLERARRMAPDLASVAALLERTRAEVGRQDAQVLAKGADLDRRLGRGRQAEDGYRMALRLDPSCPEAWSGLATLQWQRGDSAAAGDSVLQLDPASAQASSLRAWMAAERAGQGLPTAEGTDQAPGGSWREGVRAALQMTRVLSPGGDRDGRDASLYAHLGWGPAAPGMLLGYTYFGDDAQGDSAAGRTDYQALSGSWRLDAAGGGQWLLQADTAIQTGTGGLDYQHQMAALRWEAGGTAGWHPWVEAQSLWEAFPASAELDTWAPNLGLGCSAPLPWTGQVLAEVRLRADDTQAWDCRDAVLSLHAAAAWRVGHCLSPRLDIDARTLEFPDWPGGAVQGREDRWMDARLEWVLWQDRWSQVGLGAEAWLHASSLVAYAEQGNSAFAAGSVFW